jgi:hypothetical protein
MSPTASSWPTDFWGCASPTSTWPPNVTPEDYLRGMSTEGLNIADDEGFNRVNIFTPRRTFGVPTVGDIYNIDFLPGAIGDLVTVGKDGGLCSRKLQMSVLYSKL